MFPFGVPCWVVSQIEALNATPVPPSITVALPTGGGHTTSLNVNAGDLPVDVRSIYSVAREFFLVLTGIGIVMWLVGKHGGGSAAGVGRPMVAGRATTI